MWKSDMILHKGRFRQHTRGEKKGLFISFTTSAKVSPGILSLDPGIARQNWLCDILLLINNESGSLLMGPKLAGGAGVEAVGGRDAQHWEEHDDVSPLRSRQGLQMGLRAAQPVLSRGSDVTFVLRRLGIQYRQPERNLPEVKEDTSDRRRALIP